MSARTRGGLGPAEVGTKPRESDMAIMMGKLYAALRAANVPDREATEAPEEVAAFETRISNISADVRLLQWMGGFNIALSVAILLKLFTQ
jgi:hypothetical protein